MKKIVDDMRSHASMLLPLNHLVEKDKDADNLAIPDSSVVKYRIVNEDALVGENTIRLSNIELLRIITMMGVILLHYNNESAGGAFAFVEEGSAFQVWLYFVESLFAGAVDLFMIISGFFLGTSNDRRWKKMLELLLQVVIFKVAIYSSACLLGARLFSIRELIIKLLPANYFVVLYIVVYILSPYLNLILEALDEKKSTRFIVLVFLMFSCWPFLVDVLELLLHQSLNGLSTIGMWGDQYGYTIVNFMLAYLIGAYFRTKTDIRRMRRSKIALIGTGLLALIFGMSVLEHHFLGGVVSWNYNNPLLLGFVTCVFLLFDGLKIKSRVVNELAKASFTCFLLHGALIGYMGIEKIVHQQNFLILLLHQLFTAVMLYLISYVVYKIYYLCTHWLFREKEIAV